mmetsp:Transcript_17267/g.29077  ORF Transcript_17267/g.29077 Transcript_17267/m.29077 type:complete len:89 (-) Transcript_17267:470-736(-)
MDHSSDKMYVGNAGDSRAILVKSRSRVSDQLSEGTMTLDDIVQQVTIDHKPEDPIELDRIAKAGSFLRNGRVNGNLNLSRAIGDFVHK